MAHTRGSIACSSKAMTTASSRRRSAAWAESAHARRSTHRPFPRLRGKVRMGAGKLLPIPPPCFAPGRESGGSRARLLEIPIDTALRSVAVVSEQRAQARLVGRQMTAIVLGMPEVEHGNEEPPALVAQA